MSAYRRGEIWDVNLDPTVGSEIRKTRPCVIVSPDTLNSRWRTVLIAPMTTGGRAFPFRIESDFEGKPGHIVLDQLKAVDKRRCLAFRGTLDEESLAVVLATLQLMFAA